MKTILHVLRGATLAALLVIAVRAERPRVVSTVPESGANEVDPATPALRVVFDQPMNPATYSVVGGGPNFPELRGRGHWADDRTWVQPWSLEPARDYALGVNSARFTGFRNLAGEAAVPLPLAFRTAPGSTGNPPEADAGAVALQREAAGRLRRAIENDYSHFDRCGVDWPARFAACAPRLERAATARRFAEIAAEALAPAEDIHLWLRVDGIRLSPYRRRYAANFDLATLRRVVPEWRQRSRAVAVGRFPEGIAYVSVAELPAEEPAEIAPALDAIAAAAERRDALVLDLRANGGGDEGLGRRIAGCFVDAPVTYAKHVFRRDGKLGETEERVLAPNASGPRFRGRLVVLIGPGTVSSAEGFTLMLRQVPGAQLVGANTAGASGNPRPVDLGNGVTAMVPSWRSLRADGTPLEGVGIAPDIRVPTAPADFRGRDPVLDAALAALRRA